MRLPCLQTTLDSSVNSLLTKMLSVSERHARVPSYVNKLAYEKDRDLWDIERF